MCQYPDFQPGHPRAGGVPAATPPFVAAGPSSAAAAPLQAGLALPVAAAAVNVAPLPAGRRAGTPAAGGTGNPPAAGHDFRGRVRTAVLVALGLLMLAALPTAAVATVTVGPAATWLLVGLALAGSGMLLAAVPSRRLS